MQKKDIIGIRNAPRFICFPRNPGWPQLNIGRLVPPDFIDLGTAIGAVFPNDSVIQAGYEKMACDEEWGFERMNEPSLYRNDTLASKVTRYIHFAELRDWLESHARNAKERRVIQAFDYDAMALRMRDAWALEAKGSLFMINKLKRSYDELLAKVSKPVKQRKRARIEVVTMEEGEKDK